MQGRDINIPFALRFQYIEKANVKFYFNTHKMIKKTAWSVLRYVLYYTFFK